MYKTAHTEITLNSLKSSEKICEGGVNSGALSDKIRVSYCVACAVSTYHINYYVR